MTAETKHPSRVRQYTALEPGDRYFYLSDGKETTWGVARSQIVVNRYIGWGREWYEATALVESDGARHILIGKTTQDTYRQARLRGRARHIYLSQDTVFPRGTLTETDEEALYLAHSYDEQKRSGQDSNSYPLDLDLPEPPNHPLRITLFTYDDFLRQSLRRDE